MKIVAIYPTRPGSSEASTSIEASRGAFLQRAASSVAHHVWSDERRLSRRRPDLESTIMIKRLTTLGVLLVAALLASPSRAQIGPAPTIPGCYDVLQGDGSPLPGGNTGTLEIAPNPGNSSFDGTVSVNGTPLPGESMVLWPAGPYEYLFENARGHYGIMAWDGANWRTLITTGPNTGTMRQLDPQSC